MTLAERKNWNMLKGKHVEIRWREPAYDWPYFVLLDVNDDDTVWLRGADYPDGSDRHDGGVFWVMIDEVESMQEVTE